MLHLRRRGEEEKQLIQEEMGRVIKYYENESKKISASISQLEEEGDQNDYASGSLALLKVSSKVLEFHLGSVCQSFNEHISSPAVEED